MIVIGKFLRPFGVEGELLFSSYSHESAHLKAVSSFYTKDVQDNSHPPYEVENWNIGVHTVRCKIKTVDTPEDAKIFTGEQMYVQKEKAAPLQKGEHYISDLIGTQVYCEGNKIGKLVAIYTDSYAPLFEIELEQNTSVKKQYRIIPFLKHFFSEPLITKEQNNIETKTIELLDKSVLE